MKLTLYDFLRIGHIKRWHNVNTTREQTVAEHSYMVVLIAMELAVYVQPVDRVLVDDLLRLIVAAFFHDAPETAAGDTPTPAKRLIREVTGDPDIFKKIEDRLMPELPYIGGKPTPYMERLIKVADAIEGYHFIHDNGAGVHAQIVQHGARRRLEDLVFQYDKNFPDEEWYPRANKILTAMGLPYAHKESRISPP